MPFSRRSKMTEVDINVGHAIQARRVEIGLSIERLSQIAKISQDRLLCIQHGKTRPRAQELAKIAECLSVSASFFFGDWQADVQAEAAPGELDAYCGDNEN